MIVVHHLNNSRSQRVLWLLEELGIEYFAGEEFTAADIQMSFPVEMVAMLPEQVENRPQLKEFLDRIHARPAYKHALEHGGKYENFFFK